MIRIESAWDRFGMAKLAAEEAPTIPCTVAIGDVRFLAEGQWGEGPRYRTARFPIEGYILVGLNFAPLMTKAGIEKKRFRVAFHDLAFTTVEIVRMVEGGPYGDKTKIAFVEVKP